MADPPADIRAVAQRRADARRSGDYTTADELRCDLLKAGWEVVDGAEGYELRPMAAAPVVSVLVDEAWPDDAARLCDSIAVHQATSAYELVPVPPGSGFATTRNAALAKATAEVVILLDTSLELTGDLLGRLVDALADPSVAVAGPFGLVTADLREYEERSAGDVAAVQGYCLAARRTDLLSLDGYRSAFAFYRNADIDLSFRLRTQGADVRRAVAVGAELCRRHIHRPWEETEPEERDRLSRKNMRKVLDRFGDRLDLAVS